MGTATGKLSREEKVDFNQADSVFSPTSNFTSTADTQVSHTVNWMLSWMLEPFFPALLFRWTALWCGLQLCCLSTGANTIEGWHSCTGAGTAGAGNRLQCCKPRLRFQNASYSLGLWRVQLSKRAQSLSDSCQIGVGLPRTVCCLLLQLCWRRRRRWHNYCFPFIYCLVIIAWNQDM